MTASGSKSQFQVLFLSRHLSFRSKSQLAFENLRQIPLISQLSFYIACFWSFQMVPGRFRWFQAVLGYFQIVLDRYRSFQIILGYFGSFLALVSTIFLKKWKLETESEKTFWKILVDFSANSIWSKSSSICAKPIIDFFIRVVFLIIAPNQPTFLKDTIASLRCFF